MNHWIKWGKRLDTSLLSKNGSIPWSFLAELGSKSPWIFGLLGDAWCLRLKKFWGFFDDFVMVFRSHVNQSHGRLQETLAPGIETEAPRWWEMGHETAGWGFTICLWFGSLIYCILDPELSYCGPEERLIDQLKEPPASQHAGGEGLHLQN